MLQRVRRRPQVERRELGMGGKAHGVAGDRPHSGKQRAEAVHGLPGRGALGAGLHRSAGGVAVDLDATLQAMVWLYQPVAQTLMQAQGAALILSDPRIQATFWIGAAARGAGPAGAQDAGGRPSFMPDDAGWSVYPCGRSFGRTVVVPALGAPAELPPPAAAWPSLVNQA